MAFRFGDPGGRIYGAVGAGNVNLLSWWTSVGAGGGWSVVAGAGRTAGSCLRFGTSYAANQFLYKFLGTSVATLGVAMAFRTNSLPGGDAIILTFTDSTTNQIDLRLTSSGQLRVTRNGTSLGLSVSALSLNTFYHIELKSLIDPSVGTVELRLNGVAIIGPLINQITRNTANSSVNGIYLCNPNLAGGGSANLDFDDLIVWDGITTDAQNNPDIHDFIGDCGLVWLLPNGDGTTTQFARDSGTNNYLRVNEPTPDGDTSYVEDATVGHIDTYNIANLPGNIGSVKSMAVVSYARKSDFSARGMKHELRTNSTNVAHTNEIVLADSYTYYMSTWGQNPTGTPANWTVADINALEIGRQVSS